jgi:hypothetical protein
MLFADDSLTDDERAARVQVALFNNAVAAGIEPSLAEKHLTLGHANMNVMGIRRMLRRTSSA